MDQKHTHDHEYLNMVKAVLEHEDLIKENRTNTPTIGITGYMADYSLEDGYYNEHGDLVIPDFPFLTTKKVHTKAVIAELFWLLNGQTNIRFLEKNNVRIWREWPYTNYTNNNPDDPLTPEEFAHKIKTENVFAARWGELGPVYGKQWRAWDYYLNNQCYGHDQIANALTTLEKSPSSRRNIVSAWNVADIADMQLPPCHTLFQLLTTPDDDGYILDLMLTQRSLDVFLGAPFNIASYSLLLAAFAEHVGMMPGTFIHSIGDCHIYINHIPQMKEQMSREPYVGPTVTIKRGFMKKMMELPINYHALDYDELEKYIVIEHYRSHGALKGEVAI